MEKKQSWRSCSVVGCRRENRSAYFSLPTSEDLKTQWLKFIFNDNVPMTTSSCLYVCPSHFEADCFTNACQVKLGYASKLRLKEGSIPTVRDPSVKAEAGTAGSACRILSVRHVASQTDPPERRSVSTQLSTDNKSVGTQLSTKTLQNHFRSTATQVRVPSRDCGVCTLTFPLDSPLLFLQPTIVKRPSKRPRLRLTDEEEGPSECSLSMVVREPEDST
ncbi:uncharacterized protein LOC118335645 isoform X1 [Morone saxatilis]|uniref:uncharacterized protein LOC118335645 isoform X1 n=1 Tax=Morone saxatilis TaxID=34816 RepID=UPI0015E232EE|nr:uncharacterized protein LOC118335645 isoform X1 [Morone saxatilis]